MQLHPLRTIHTVPHLRSETAAHVADALPLSHAPAEASATCRQAAHVTDAMRVALLRAAGYRVAASEFVARPSRDFAETSRYIAEPFAET